MGKFENEGPEGELGVCLGDFQSFPVGGAGLVERYHLGGGDTRCVEEFGGVGGGGYLTPPAERGASLSSASRGGICCLKRNTFEEL